MIEVGAHKIGEGQPPFIIAEVGSNWRTFQDCMDSVVKAKHSGADAVKFQLFHPMALFGDVPGTWSMSLDYSMPHDWIPKLAEKAKACGIEFMCTAFSPELYDVVNPHVSIHKIASAEACHKRILERVVSYGKPVILSTGAKGKHDIAMALEILKPVPVVLMYCVAAYPAQNVNLGNIYLLHALFDRPAGYSDHTTDIGVIPAVAVEAGAVVIEKHFNATMHTDTPDAGHSLNPEQFATMVKIMRMGGNSPEIAPLPEERPMLLRHNRRLIATRDIGVDELLQEGVNFGIYRSLKDDTRAYHPFAVDYVNGKRVKSPITAGNGISAEDIYHGAD